MISKFFSRAGALLAIVYVAWFVYERFTCLACWGNDLFFSIPFMVLVPASMEGSVLAKYLVVLANAALIWLLVSGLGSLPGFLFRIFKK